MKLYQNKDWLYKMYWKKKLSPRQIGKLVEVSYMTIWRELHKFDISLRSCGEGCHLARANHCNLTQEAEEWLNGELLGDSCLHSQHPYSAGFRYSSKYLEYIQYISNTLQSFGIEQSGKINERYHKNLDCYSYYFASRDYVELLPIKKHWYPEGKKIVPRDTELTSLTCRQWYIGDGCLKYSQLKRPSIYLFTNAFPILDVIWLVEELNKKGFKATKRNYDNVIRISIYSTKAFLNYIGKCPVECYKYKWNYNKEE